MDGYERLNTAEKQINNGDVKGLRATLDTLPSQEDRQRFMRMMKDRCVYNSTSPDCEIVGSDEGISQISYKGTHALEIKAEETGKLKARLTNPTVMDLIDEYVYEEKQKAAEEAKVAQKAKEECKKTDDSIAEKAFKAQYKQSTGEEL